MENDLFSSVCTPVKTFIVLSVLSALISITYSYIKTKTFPSASYFCCAFASMIAVTSGLMMVCAYSTMLAWCSVLCLMVMGGCVYSTISTIL